MENQHKKIKGYRDLSKAEIDLMNSIKEKGVELGVLVEDLKAVHARQRNEAEAQAASGDSVELDRINAAEPDRWRSIGRSHFQEGLMALTRSVAQPEFF